MSIRLQEKNICETPLTWLYSRKNPLLKRKYADLEWIFGSFESYVMQLDDYIDTCDMAYTTFAEAARKIINIRPECKVLFTGRGFLIRR